MEQVTHLLAGMFVGLLIGGGTVAHIAAKAEPHREQMEILVGKGCEGSLDGVMVASFEDGFGLGCKEINRHTVEIVK